MRNRYILVADLILLGLCAFGAFALRLDWSLGEYGEYERVFWFYAAAALAFKPPVFALFGLYSRDRRYASVRELVIVLLAVSASSVVQSTLMLVLLRADLVESVPRSVLFIDWILTMCCVGGIRLSVRVFAEPLRRGAAGPPGTLKRVLVAGAGDAGSMVVREMRRNPSLGMTPIGFVDDDVAKIGKRIHDVPVLGPLKAVAQVAERHAVDEVVIAMPKAPGGVVRTVVSACQESGIAARALPGVFELLDGKVSVNRLRNVEITDLLRRAEVTPLPERRWKYLEQRVVLVTGAGGSIGAELCRQVSLARPSSLVLVGHGENSIYDIEVELRTRHPHLRLTTIIADVRDRARLHSVFKTFEPGVVFHAAAHKHVPLMEHNVVEAVTNNVIGTRTVAEAALVYDVERFLLVSTDKAVEPRSVMGATKRLAEMVVRDLARTSQRRFGVVRFGNVLGSRGSVVPRFKAQIEAGGPVTITHRDMTRYFMTIPEAVYLVIEAGGLVQGGELFVLNMGQPVRILDLAEDLIRLSGFSVDEMPILTIGLRPGEKLHESLWDAGARVEPTANPDVLSVTEHDPPLTSVSASALAELERACDRQDDQEAKARLAELLPEFVPFDPEVAMADLGSGPRR